MLGVGLEVLVVVVLILANGLFAMSELALVSVREVRLRRLSEEGHAGARAAAELVGDPSRFLSAVQIGISLVAVFLGAFGGAAIADDLAAPLGRVAVLAPYAESLALAVVVIGITYVSLVFGELVPKRLALSNPEKVASLVSRPMTLLATAASPVVWLLSFSTDTVIRLLGASSSSEPQVTEEEIKRLIRQATSAGIFEPVEQELVEKVFRVGDRRADSLATPRSDISWLDVNGSVDGDWAEVWESGHSEFPVCDGTLDKVLGTVSVKRLWVQAAGGRAPDLREALREALQPARLVPENTPALEVLDIFREAGRHVLLLIDEYGLVQGLVTPVDVLEAIAGAIPTRDEPPEPRATRLEDGSWLLDGSLRVDTLQEILGLQRLPEEGRAGYRTVGGLMMLRLRRVPEEGEGFEWEGMTFEVVDMDESRVDKVRVVPDPQEQEQAST